jgi:hypothetical protein
VGKKQEGKKQPGGMLLAHLLPRLVESLHLLLLTAGKSTKRAKAFLHRAAMQANHCQRIKEHLHANALLLPKTPCKPHHHLLPKQLANLIITL